MPGNLPDSRLSRCKQLLLALMIVSGPVISAQERFIIGAQNIDYYPHYAFDARHDKGYAWAVLEAFGASEGIEFDYLSLPIKRLQTELLKGTVDFAYPDNPNWNSPDIREKKSFSQPFAVALGGTMVTPLSVGRGLGQFKTLSVPHGFTPVMWLELIEAGKVNLIAVADARATLDMVLFNRASGADIEYHVAEHQLRTSGQQGQLVLDSTLPYDEVAFTLSSINYPDILAKLDRFLHTDAERLSRLKERYQMMEPAEILEKYHVEPKVTNRAR